MLCVPTSHSARALRCHPCGQPCCLPSHAGGGLAFTQHEWLRAAQSEQRRTSAANRLAHSVPCLHRNAMCRKQQHGLFTRMRLDRLKLLGDTLYDRCDKLHSTGDVKPSQVRSSQVSAPRPVDAAARTEHVRSVLDSRSNAIRHGMAWHTPAGARATDLSSSTASCRRVPSAAPAR